MAQSPSKWVENTLFMSNFSFSLSVFKRLVVQTRKNQDLFRKGLKYLVSKDCEDTKVFGKQLTQVICLTHSHTMTTFDAPGN